MVLDLDKMAFDRELSRDKHWVPLGIQLGRSLASLKSSALGRHLLSGVFRA